LEGIEQLVWERRTRREQQIAEEHAEDDPEARGRPKQKHVQQNQREDAEA
jgi:potassium channel subfamily K